MKTAKTIIGIISIVLFVLIMFQSCATGVGNALNENTTDTSGGGGMFVAFLILIAGLVGVATRNSKGGGIAAGIFYLAAALVGFMNLGTFADLMVWSIMSVVFGVIFIVGSLAMKKPAKDISKAG